MDIIFYVFLSSCITNSISVLVQEQNSHSAIKGKQLQKLLVNGVDSPSYRQFYAQIVFRDGFCGATIINSYFVLTAGHCVFRCRS